MTRSALRYDFTTDVLDVRTYDDDGQLVRNVVSGDRRDTELDYDTCGKLVKSANAFGTQDTLTAEYSSLGHLLTSPHRGEGVNLFGLPLTTTTYDTLGTTRSGISPRRGSCGGRRTTGARSRTCLGTG